MAKGRRPVNAESRLSPLHPAAPCRVWGLGLHAKAEMTEGEGEGGGQNHSWSRWHYWCYREAWRDAGVGTLVPKCPDLLV